SCGEKKLSGSSPTGGGPTLCPRRFGERESRGHAPRSGGARTTLSALSDRRRNRLFQVVNEGARAPRARASTPGSRDSSMASIVSRRRSRTTFASYVFALALFAPQMGVRAQDLVITELMAQNVQTLTDTDGEYSDWIEIYNAGDVEVDLEGYHLSDRTNNLAKWTFPSVVLPPGGFLTVFCSGKDFREVG